MKRSLVSLPIVAGLMVFIFHGAPAAQSDKLKPINLTNVNTPGDEDDPYLFVSRDGRVSRLFYASKASGRFNIYVSKPNSRGEWLAGAALESLDTTTENRSPCLSGDGHDFYYATKFILKAPNKEDGRKPENFDIGHAINLGSSEQFTGATPVHSVCTPADELYPWLTANGRELYFSRMSKESWRVFVAARPGTTGAFGEPKLVEELPPGYHHATISSDGRKMIVQGPLQKNRWGLFRSSRRRNGNLFSPWSPPQPLERLNSTPEDAPQGDMSPCLSRDDLKLYFASDRRGGKGGRDLWVIAAPSLLVDTGK